MKKEKGRRSGKRDDGEKREKENEDKGMSV